MGYTAERSAWTHPDRSAVFVGDLIDRGPGQLETIRVVRAMVAAGSALHCSIINWFMTIPMWLDLGGLRVVHACWSPKHIAHLESVAGPSNTLTEQIVIDGTTNDTATYDAIETVPKGLEINLDGAWYHDKDGKTTKIDDTKFVDC